MKPLNIKEHLREAVGFRRARNEIMESLGATEETCATFVGPQGIYVIITGNIEQDGKRWIHISVSKKNKKGKCCIPSYSDLCHIKREFLGAEAIAYHVFAPSEEHVNIHPGCLHLWAPLDHRPTPDFTWGMGTI